MQRRGGGGALDVTAETVSLRHLDSLGVAWETGPRGMDSTYLVHLSTAKGQLRQPLCDFGGVAAIA